METSKYITRHLDRLLLDPNNYRFLDHRDYKEVPDTEVADKRIQLRTQSLLVGKNNENIRDLIGSFKANGILMLDPIQVKEIPDNKFVVVEGNRRTAALKHLQDEFKAGNDVGKLTQESFKSVAVVLISGESPVQHLVTMGLHHISGKRKWSPVNQAQLIYDLYHKHGQSEQDIMEALSITKQGLRRALRTLSFINAYKDSDYGDQFVPTKYSIFEEVIKTPAVKNWLGWEDQAMACTDPENLEKLFSWISTEEEFDGEEREDLIRKEPIITKSHEIRELGKFIQDSAAVAKMEESRSVTTGFVLSEAVGEQRFRNAIDNLGKDVHAAFQFSEFMGETDLERVTHLRDKLDSLIPSSKALIEKSETLNIETMNPEVAKHFDSFIVESFGRLRDIRLNKLSRVNIVAGANNMGKTTLLEAFYISTQLNNLNALVEQERYRGKFYKAFRSYWLNRNFISDAAIGGTFNDQDVWVKIQRSDATEAVDKSHYLASIEAECMVEEICLKSIIHLFNNREPEEFYERRRTLCRATFTSPFRYNEEQLAKAYDQAISQKYLDKVVTFIRRRIDSDIEKIEMSSDRRFLVSSRRFDEAVDITRFGEGLQRVFEIALLMGYSRDGLICIDEVDAAVHKSLLVDFTKFIQEAAVEFNVQVILSTHSKECIDAFIENDFRTSDITAHALTLEDEEIVCRHLSGEKLGQLINSIDFDLR